MSGLSILTFRFLLQFEFDEVKGDTLNVYIDSYRRFMKIYHILKNIRILQHVMNSFTLFIMHYVVLLQEMLFGVLDTEFAAFSGTIILKPAA